MSATRPDPPDRRARASSAGPGHEAANPLGSSNRFPVFQVSCLLRSSECRAERRGFPGGGPYFLFVLAAAWLLHAVEMLTHPEAAARLRRCAGASRRSLVTVDDFDASGRAWRAAAATAARHARPLALEFRHGHRDLADSREDTSGFARRSSGLSQHLNTVQQPGRCKHEQENRALPPGNPRAPSGAPKTAASPRKPERQEIGSATLEDPRADVQGPPRRRRRGDQAGQAESRSRARSRRRARGRSGRAGPGPAGFGALLGQPPPQQDEARLQVVLHRRQPQAGSSRSSRLANSVRPSRRWSVRTFQRIFPGTFRIRYSPSTKTQSSFR